MSSKFLRVALIVSAVALLAFIAGCSDSKVEGANSQSMTDQIVADFVDTTLDDIAVKDTAAEYAVAVEDQGVVGPSAPAETPDIDALVYDFIVKDNRIIALVEDGVLIHNLDDGSNQVIPMATAPGALIDMGEKILIGGDNLYTLDGNSLTCEDNGLSFDGQITSLHHRGMRLYIGTTEALYCVKTGEIRELTSGIHVSTLTTDDYGLWVGTAGDGLYFWNGDEFQKRFLRRDTTLFNNVTALATLNGHIYLGTDRGFFDYDGGRWIQYTTVDGLPSDFITAINADSWVVKIGTANGAVTFYENNFKPINRLDGMAVMALAKLDKRLLAATGSQGLIMRSGGLVTTLYNGTSSSSAIALEDEN